MRYNPPFWLRRLETGALFCAERDNMKPTNRMDRKTAAKLDAEINAMPEDEQRELETLGDKVIKGRDTAEGRMKYNAAQTQYMRKYRKRIALARQRGLLNRGE